MKRFFTTGDIARYCEVDVNTIKRWIRSGLIKAFTTPTGHFRIRSNDFIDFIRDQGYPFDAKYFGDKSYGTDVLIIDDDQATVDLLSYLLENLNGEIRIKSTTNGFDAYKLIEELHPRLILIDLNMPRISGIELLKAIRDREDLIDVEIVAVSAYLDDETRKTLKNLKITSMLSKPVTKEKLEEVCKAILVEG